MLSMLIVLSIASRVSILSRVEFEHLRIAIMLSRWSVESLVGLAKILKQIAGEIKKPDPGRTRACNLWFRIPTPYPLGHREN